MITRNEILMGRDTQYPLTPELETNLKDLLEKLNKFRTLYGKSMICTSGYRPGNYNTAAGGAKKSSHMLCMAADFRDTDGSLDAWCMQHIDKLNEIGLYLEHPDATPGWCHLQTRKTKNNPFRP